MGLFNELFGKNTPSSKKEESEESRMKIMDEFLEEMKNKPDSKLSDIRYLEILRDANNYPSFSKPLIDRSPRNLTNSMGMNIESNFKYCTFCF